MENYAVLSLETHLFFARIMKEHGLFLEAGFPCSETECIQTADWYREKFEDLLREVVELADGRVNSAILNSGEVVTDCTKSLPRRLAPGTIIVLSFHKKIAVFEYMLYC